ncbi:MAG: hypothetical protein RL642_747, partial [Bacteroidota bacterium]
MVTFNKYFVVKNIVVFAFLLLTQGLLAQNGYLPRESFEGAAYTLAVHEVNFEGVQTNSKMRLPYS